MADQPAFPTHPGLGSSQQGMSLRDWFASNALMSGLVRDGGLQEYEYKALFGSRTGIRREEIIAAEAYRIADALLAERARVTVL